MSGPTTSSPAPGSPLAAPSPWGGGDAPLLELASRCSGPLLAIDSSEAQATLCLVIPATGQVLERALAAASLPSESLVAGVEEICAAAALHVADVAALIVGLGPGSFTGLRVGLATVKGLALGTGLPVYGVSSLQMLAAAAGVAQDFPADGDAPAGPAYVLAVRDARRDAFYAGLYAVHPDGGSQVLLADAVWSLAGLTRAVAASLGDDARQMSHVIVVGDAALAIAQAWQARVIDVAPQARFALAAAASALLAGHADDLASLTPRYLRGEMVPPPVSRPQ